MSEQKTKRVFKCLRCGRDFESASEVPGKCTHCKSDFWDSAPRLKREVS